MSFKRSFGVLLHPTSFPSKYGIGDLGNSAYEFIDYLKEMGATLWQILPLGPTGYGDSPYACFSAIAGNPLIISIDKLIEDGLLSNEDLQNLPNFSNDFVDYGNVINYKNSLYKKAFNNFLKLPNNNEFKNQFENFKNDSEINLWLDDYALFMALKEKYNYAVWNNFEHKLAMYDKDAILKAKSELHLECEYHKFLQFVFYKQWLKLKEYANNNNIKIIGDIPIFVAYDSADVWSNREIFKLDSNGNPTVVAGVPPDYFSETGQLWGNPLYDWDVLEKQEFKWWIFRIKAILKYVDIIRIDHFRGFEACWEVPFGSQTAINGKWVKTKGKELFLKLNEKLGNVPIIAEDLGVITPEVEKLRDDFGFIGMKILQFAFDGDSKNAYLPHNYNKNCVVYTGTHDNETTLGWFLNLSNKDKEYVLKYCNGSDVNIHNDMIRLAISSVATLAIIPLQDILGLNNDARMNTPGKASGNWGYRYKQNELKHEYALKIKELCKLYGRI